LLLKPDDLDFNLLGVFTVNPFITTSEEIYSTGVEYLPKDYYSFRQKSRELK